MSTIAETTSGPIQGRIKDDMLLFAGIPYAAAPIGDLRFAAPQAHAGWSEVLVATKFGPAAPQIPSGGMTDNTPVNWNEDCLFLNISTPALDDKKRPILFWIHGGGYRTGQGAIPWYNGRNFASNGDIVVVSINYRIGAFGFANLAGYGEKFATSGANGLLDQITALEWVRDNIQAFGGNPQQITIAGESAGGFAVSSLLGSQRAEGLFTRAIPQSGAAQHTMSKVDGEKCAAALMQILNVDSAEALQQVDAEALLQAQTEVDKMEAAGELGISGSTMAFYPSVGNGVLPESPLTAIQGGQGKNVDVLTGTNKDEATLFVQGKVDEAKLGLEVTKLGGDDGLIAAYRQRYPNASAKELATFIQTDHMFRIPAVRLAEARAATGANTWMYRFDWESRNAALKATHSLEIPFAFDNLDKPGVSMFTGPGESPQAVADVMHAIWTRFIRGETLDWPQYEDTDRVSMIFDTESRTQNDVDDGLRQAWAGIR